MTTHRTPEYRAPADRPAGRAAGAGPALAAVAGLALGGRDDLHHRRLGGMTRTAAGRPGHRPAGPGRMRQRVAATRKPMPAARSRSVSASPIATAVVTCPDVGGSSSSARQSAASANIFAVSS